MKAAPKSRSGAQGPVATTARWSALVSSWSDGTGPCYPGLGGACYRRALRQPAAASASPSPPCACSGWRSASPTWPAGSARSGPDYWRWAFDHHSYSDLLTLYSPRYLDGGHPLPYLAGPDRVPAAPRPGALAPRLRAGRAAGYLAVSALFLAGCLAADALGPLVACRTRSPWWLAATPALAYYAFLNWDLLPIALIAGSLLALQRGRAAGVRRRWPPRRRRQALPGGAGSGRLRRAGRRRPPAALAALGRRRRRAAARLNLPLALARLRRLELVLPLQRRPRRRELGLARAGRPGAAAASISSRSARWRWPGSGALLAAGAAARARRRRRARGPARHRASCW